MFKPRPEVYLGKQFADGFIGHFATDKFFGVLSFEDGISQDEGKQLIETFKNKLGESSLKDLASFEAVIANLIVTLNLPLHMGLAIGFLSDEIFYLKTVGSGRIYLRRKERCQMILSGDKVASGPVINNDLFIFSNQTIENMIGKDSDIQVFTRGLSGVEIIKKIIEEESYDDDEPGFVFFLVEFNAIGEEVLHKELEISKEAPDEQVAKTSVLKSGFKIQQIIRDKRFVILVAIILASILAWSVIFGYQRRQLMMINQKIDTASQEIEKKLTLAKEQSESDFDEALQNIDLAKNMLLNLKKELGDNVQKDKLSNIQESIEIAQKSISNKNLVDYEEFFDLAIEKKDAQGVALSLEDDFLAILDKELSVVYVLDMKKKSLAQFVSPLLKEATLIGLFREEVYFFSPQNGVYKFTAQNKTTSLIPNDSEWGEIKSFKIFNGNIYLLDKDNLDIYRYLVAEGGYSSRRSYLTESKLSNDLTLSDMDIDGAIYVSHEKGVEKFLSGKKEPFEPTFPNKDVKIKHISVSLNENDRVFALDYKNNSIYAFSKNGEYKETAQSEILTEGSIIVSYDNSTYVLSGSKIYKLKN